MRVLAIGAHFDDVELGCGGSLARHVEQGDEVTVFVATHSGYSGPNGQLVRAPDTALAEGREAARSLGVSELICGGFETNSLRADDDLVCALLNVIERCHADLIYTHWSGDTHLDHQNLSKATLSASRHINSLLMYRSNLYHSAEVFTDNFFVDTSRVFARKLQAIAAFRTELSRVSNRWMDDVEIRDRLNGRKLGVAYAEAFGVVRYVV